MSVNTTTNKIEHAGDGTTTVFTYNFRILESGHLKVYVDGFIQNSGYTVAGVGEANGGSVTFAVAPANGTKVLLVRVVPQTQPTTFVDNVTVLGGVIDSSLDRLTMLVQQLQEGLDRAVQIPLGTDNDLLASIEANILQLVGAPYVYLGPYAAPPTARPEVSGGGVLQPGDIYFDTTAKSLRAWDGSQWFGAAAVATINSFRYTATAGQTVFTGADLDGKTLALADVSMIFLNGVRLTPTQDYAVAANGGSVTLTEAAIVGDELTAVSFRQIHFSQLPAEVQQNAIDAAASAFEAAMYDGPKVDTFAELAGVLPSQLAVGGYIRVISTGGVYQRVASGGDLDYTGTGGVRFTAVPTLRPEMFPSIEAAITAAAQSGLALRGTPGVTYTFTTGVTVTDQPLRMDMTGCSLVRSAAMANRSALRIDHSFSAATYSAADAVVAYSLVDYDFGNGATTVPRITVASVANYAVGQVVKVLSPDRIPSIAPWQDTRYAEMGEIGAVDAVNNYVYLIRPFAETWTPAKIVRLTNQPVLLVGGEWSDEVGYPVDRNTPMIELRGCVRPVYRQMTLRDTASTQLSIESCYEPLSQDNNFYRPRHSVTYMAYAYGEKVICGTMRPVQDGAVGSGCRHVWDTVGVNIADGDLNASSPLLFGGVIQGTVQNGVGYDSLNAPFNDHPDAFETRILNCSSRYTNRRSPAATLWGLQLRGRGTRVIGGIYESINPCNIQPSTSIMSVLRNVTFVKRPASTADAARESAVDVVGGGVVSGKANVLFDNCRVEQNTGRKELVDLNNASATWSGSISYAADLSNAVAFRLDAASDLRLLDTDFDFSQSSAATPMLVSLLDASSRVAAPGRVTIKGSPAGGSSIVLTDFNNAAGSADFRDVVADGSLFSSESGWRNAGSASLRRATVRRSDTGATSGDVSVNFSGGSGAKTVSWPTGAGDLAIYVAVNPTSSGTTLGTIPNGVFAGQRVILSNVGSFTFDVPSISNVTVGATRTVAIGGQLVMRWDGTVWRA